MADTSLGFNLIGRDISASSALQKVGKEAESTGGAFAKIGTIAAGVFSGEMLASAATSVVEFGKQSLDAFSEVGQEVIKLQRYTGGTAESMSQLRFAAEESGVSADQLASALGKMEKAASGPAKGFQAIGVAVKDAHGALRPASDLFMEAADRLSKMQNGTQKTAEVMQIFGKSGMALLPMLNQGKAGMEELAKQSDKLGLTLSQKNLDAVHANVMAHREFDAAIQGVQVQLGENLLPALTTIIQAFTKLMPLVMDVLKPAFEGLGLAISFIADQISNASTFISNFFTGLGDGTTKLSGLSNVVSGFSPILGDFKSMWENVRSTIRQFEPEIQTVAGFLRDDLLSGFTTFVDVIRNDVLPGIQKFYTMMYSGVASAVKMVTDTLKSHKTQIDEVITAVKTIAGWWTSYLEIIMKVDGWIVQHLAPILGWLANNVFKFLGQAISWVIDSQFILIDVWSKVIGAAINVGKGIGSAFGSVKTVVIDLINALETPLNLVIGVINRILNIDFGPLHLHFGEIATLAPIAQSNAVAVDTQAASVAQAAVSHIAAAKATVDHTAATTAHTAASATDTSASNANVAATAAKGSAHKAAAANVGLLTQSLRDQVTAEGILAMSTNALGQKLGGTGIVSFTQQMLAAGKITDQTAQDFANLGNTIKANFTQALSDANNQLVAANSAFANYRDSIASSIAQGNGLSDAASAETTAIQAVTDATKAQQDAVEALQQAKAGGNQSQIDSAQTALDSANTNLSAAKAKQGDFLSFMAVGADTASAFASQIDQLRLAGASLAVTQQIAGLGAQTGGRIISELLSGGQAAIQRANQLVDTVTTVSQAVGVAAATEFYQGGINAAQALIDGIQAQMPMIQSILDGIAAALSKALGKNVASVDLGGGSSTTVSPTAGNPGGTVASFLNSDVGGFMGLTIPHMASGGVVSHPTVALVGEAGPEAIVPLHRMSGGGGGVAVTVNVGGSVVQEHDLAVTVRDQIAQMMRRRGLSPSVIGV